MAKNWITDEVKALIGKETKPRTAWHPIEKPIVRHFYQSVGDINPIYWDEEYAKKTKYGGVVAPPLFAGQAFDMPDGMPDPLEGKGGDPTYAGFGSPREVGVNTGEALPGIPIPFGRSGLNAGPEHELYQLPKVGDVITAKTRYKNIYQKEGRSGTMIFTVTETIFTNQKGEVLHISRGSGVRWPDEEGRRPGQGQME